MTVAIIDSGGSNLRSVAKAIDRLNKSYVITDIADEIMKASFVILPTHKRSRWDFLRI